MWIIGSAKPDLELSQLGRRVVRAEVDFVSETGDDVVEVSWFVDEAEVIFGYYSGGRNTSVS